MHGNGELQNHPEELLERAIRGNLEPEDRLRLESHVAACTDCAAELEGAHVLRAAMAPGKQDSALNHAAVMSALLQLKEPETLVNRLRRWLVPTRLPLLATVLFGVAVITIVGFSLLYARGRPAAQLASAPALHALTLNDGSNVTPLDAKTDVQLVEQTAARTTVRLRAGGAKFRVRHDTNRMFRVDTGPIQIEDIGTAFRVDREAGDKIHVWVTEGRVAVLHPGGGWRIELGAGEERVFSLVNEASDQVNEAPLAPSPSVQVDSNRAEIRTRNADDPAELLKAADLARRAHQPHAAVVPLRRLLERYPKDPRVPAAAFTLGWVLLTDLGRPRDAALAFATAERSAPHGGLAEDAAARVAESWQKAGDSRRAADAARHYERVYPSGRYIALMRGLIGNN